MKLIEIDPYMNKLSALRTSVVLFFFFFFTRTIWPVFCSSKINNQCILFSSVNKQINDKERISAAMENPNLKALVEQCILERDM